MTDHLTTAEAVHQLEMILDTKPWDDDLPAMHRWKMDNGAQVARLEAFITADATPEPAPVPAVCPVVALLAPKAKAKPLSPTAPFRSKTSADKIATRSAAYLVVIERLKTDPASKRYRSQARSTLGQIKVNAREGGLAMPDLPPIPPFPPFIRHKDHKPRPAKAPVQHHIVQVIISADGRDCAAVLEDGSHLVRLTSLGADARVGNLAEFAFAGCMA